MTSDALSPRDAERLLDGSPVTEASDLSEFAGRLRDHGRRPIPEDLEDRHIALMLGVFEGMDARAARRRPFPSKPRLALSSFAVKAAAATLVVSVTGGALAATGNVPVVQDRLADAVSAFIDLPGGSDDDVQSPPERQSASDPDNTNTNEPARVETTGAGESEDGTSEGSNRARIRTGADATVQSGSDSGSTSGSNSGTESDDSDEPAEPEEEDIDTSNDDHDDPPDAEEPDLEDGVGPGQND